MKVNKNEPMSHVSLIFSGFVALFLFFEGKTDEREAREIYGENKAVGAWVRVYALIRRCASDYARKYLGRVVLMGEEKKQGKNKKGRFTKGNNYAKGNKGKGKYKKAYIDELILYFSAEPTKDAEYPMFEGFAKKIGVTVRTLERWAAEKEDFGEAYERCRDVQRRFLVLGGLTERYNSAFAKFMCGVHGMSDKNAAGDKDGDTGGSSGGLDVVITLLEEKEKEGNPSTASGPPPLAQGRLKKEGENGEKKT